MNNTFLLIFCCQKLQRRKKVLEEAATGLHWSATLTNRVKSLMQEDYMSSETSAEESDTETYAFKVKKLKWLKRRYRRAFHELDEFHQSKQSKRSRSMTRPRMASKHVSQRPVPASIPSWAKSEQAVSDHDSALDTSLSSLSSSADNII